MYFLGIIPLRAVSTSFIASYITLYNLISTFSFFACCSAASSGLTLNPIIIALDTDAKVTSDSFIPPVDAWSILTLTSSLESFSNESFIASTEPWTSAFIIIFNSLILPCLICPNKSSSVILLPCFIKSNLCFAILFSINCFATFSFSTS